MGQGAYASTASARLPSTDVPFWVQPNLRLLIKRAGDDAASSSLAAARMVRVDESKTMHHQSRGVVLRMDGWVLLATVVILGMRWLGPGYVLCCAVLCCAVHT